MTTAAVPRYTGPVSTTARLDAARKLINQRTPEQIAQDRLRAQAADFQRDEFTLASLNDTFTASLAVAGVFVTLNILAPQVLAANLTLQIAALLVSAYATRRVWALKFGTKMRISTPWAVAAYRRPTTTDAFVGSFAAAAGLAAAGVGTYGIAAGVLAVWCAVTLGRRIAVAKHHQLEGETFRAAMKRVAEDKSLTVV